MPARYRVARRLPTAGIFPRALDGRSCVWSIQLSRFLMKRFLPVLLAAAVFGGGFPAQAQLRNGDYLAICGDSITEQKLYSVFIEDYLLMCQPAADLQASQFGWGGEAAGGFLDRVENDVLPFKPTAATLCYGMNDGGYQKLNPDLLSQYRRALTDVVKKFKTAGLREIVVGGPGAVDTTSFKGGFLRPVSAEDYNHTLAEFTKAAGEVAKAENVTFADLHATMLAAMAGAKERYGKDYLLIGGDGIHPPESGQLVMAYAFLKALGCKGDIGTITLDLDSGRAEATDGHRVLSASKNSAQLESTRYPFCFWGDPSKNDATSGIIEFIPFNEDLNRLTLVVKNAPAGPVKVTWGTTTKTFAGADLARGINLAAEFLDNPFVGPFRQVQEAVLRQQRYETPMVKDLLHSMPEWRQKVAEKNVPYDAFRENLISMDAVLRRAARAAVVPVRHEIRIEPGN